MQLTLIVFLAMLSFAAGIATDQLLQTSPLRADSHDSTCPSIAVATPTTTQPPTVTASVTESETVTENREPKTESDSDAEAEAEAEAAPSHSPASSSEKIAQFASTETADGTRVVKIQNDTVILTPEEVRTTDDAATFLRQKTISDLASVLAKAKPLRDQRVAAVNGDFSGQIQFDEQGKSPWDIQIKLNGKVENGALRGKNDVVILNAGETISRSKGSGKVSGYKTAADDDRAVIIDVFDGDGYIQVYSVEQLDSLVGNFYFRKGDEEFKKIGTVALTKNPDPK